MIAFQSRKLQGMRNTLYVSLPCEWVAHAGLKKGDRITPVLAKDGTSLLIKIKPEVETDA